MKQSKNNSNEYISKGIFAGRIPIKKGDTVRLVSDDERFPQSAVGKVIAVHKKTNTYDSRFTATNLDNKRLLDHLVETNAPTPDYSDRMHNIF